MNNFWIIFLTGLTTGGISCMAIQGGLLTSAIANQKKGETTVNKSLGAVIMFLSAKLLIYTLFGFLLGAVGAFITLGLGLRMAFQIFTAVFMLATAFNLLNLHPIFRYLSFQPPKFINRLVRNESKSKNLFAPFILGLMTLFIPCGVTQAMEVLAVNSGSALKGATMMFAFILGTTPLFTIMGVVASRAMNKWKEQFAYVAAFILIIMAAYSLNGVLIVLNSPVSMGGSTAGTDEKTSDQGLAPNENGVQKVTINIQNTGYEPNYFKVKKGTPVELTLTTDNVYSCASAFVFRSFNIFAQLKPKDSQKFDFTPTAAGTYRFSCAMGMYTGTMEVI